MIDDTADETARQALLEAAAHIDEMRSALFVLIGTMAHTRDWLAVLSERVASIEARMHNDGK